ncbi:MAG: hypothetical protein JWO41_858 [Candidatus Saccharibacteria bacterium]|nr:hypothetical protein [Candidatus Saccharibacteria bacterium]
MARRSQKPNVYAFIDSQNLNLGIQRNGWKMDWRKFRLFLQEKYGVTHAYMFIGYMFDNESLYEYMYELGFLVVLKPTLEISNPENDKAVAETKNSDNPVEKEKPLIKGNVDTELVLYAMKEMPNYDKAIIVSGDGDFFSLAEYLQEQGKLAHIMTPNWQFSSLLKVFDDKIVRLDQLRRQLSYYDHKKKSK